jgi:hypothetical protein
METIPAVEPVPVPKGWSKYTCLLIVFFWKGIQWVFNIGLIYGIGTSNLGSWNGHWGIDIHLVYQKYWNGYKKTWFKWFVLLIEFSMFLGIDHVSWHRSLANITLQKTSVGNFSTSVFLAKCDFVWISPCTKICMWFL